MRGGYGRKPSELFELEPEFRPQIEGVDGAPPVWRARELVRVGSGGIVERGELEEVWGGEGYRGRSWCGGGRGAGGEPGGEGGHDGGGFEDGGGLAGEQIRSISSMIGCMEERKIAH